MSHVAQNLRGLDAVGLAAKGRKAADAGATPAGVAIIGAAPVELTDLDTATTEFETANAEEATAQAALDVKANTRKEKQAVFQVAFSGYCKFSDPKCKGLASNITTLELDVAADNSPIGELDQPANFIAFIGKILGQIKLDWDNVAGSQFFLVQICDDPMNDANWRQVAIVTASKATIAGLVSGQKYWFRVCAHGAAGDGPWSDPATMRAP